MYNSDLCVVNCAPSLGRMSVTNFGLTEVIPKTGLVAILASTSILRDDFIESYRPSLTLHGILGFKKILNKKP